MTEGKKWKDKRMRQRMKEGGRESERVRGIEID
jgi:hypothetical protein